MLRRRGNGFYKKLMGEIDQKKRSMAHHVQRPVHLAIDGFGLRLTIDDMQIVDALDLCGIGDDERLHLVDRIKLLVLLTFINSVFDSVGAQALHAQRLFKVDILEPVLVEVFLPEYYPIHGSLFLKLFIIYSKK
jgi:hypothetical protein